MRISILCSNPQVEGVQEIYPKYAALKYYFLAEGT
jgi:hypothetical protein